ncbi:RNA-binding protein S1 [Ligilactobacillus agilis]|uniref:S1 domain-containing RNA-binding protein n=1 Tax=Ligilactobacillus agilis TaxID=1601 RepID=UPI00067E7121|nr:S1 domain-containing RNA-binding protein [Ligilactobacillus agilis]UNL43096.1 RNA-binding protein S1 [Ligilactobacillus agilis]UNL59068.1 RNA-binding protein S1 [Ligilactobacillus agilis]
MSVEVGTKVTGKISGITNFGAFVDLGDKQTGLVHISEVSDGFVKDIHDVLAVGDEVQVKILSVGDDGKIALSIRKAMAKKPSAKEHQPYKKHEGDNNNGRFHHEHNRNRDDKRHSFNNSKRNNDGKKKDFDSLLAGFLKESEDRLTSLKRNTEGKRGGRGGRRS